MRLWRQAEIVPDCKRCGGSGRGNEARIVLETAAAPVGKNRGLPLAEPDRRRAYYLATGSSIGSG
ncbi:hypothetical protein AYM39_01795 [Methylomonas sp. DH-1]|nr:hypothetical protein AYM39_01795 [Methylomonas sp. DH-1]